MYNIINSTIPCILLREDHQPRNAEKYGDTEKHRSKLIKKQIYLDIWFFK